eukprot:4580444-Alexandrium_andersonii.AAC.1
MSARPVCSAVAVDEGPQAGEAFIPELSMGDPGPRGSRAGVARPPGRVRSTPSIQALLGPAPS